jgi:hypothetical protein
MRNVVAISAAFSWLCLVPALIGGRLFSSFARAESNVSKEPPIVITINPEARVSVVLAGALPPPSACGTSTDLSVRIVNQGSVTARLEARLVDEPPPGVAVELDPAPLRGVAEEKRILHVRLAKPGLTDLTIAFRAHNGIPDLGGRDRIHFLIQCR